MRLARGAVVACCALAAVPVVASGASPPAGVHISDMTVPSRVLYAEKAELAGRVAPTAAVAVTIERLQPDGTWRAVGTVRSGPDGRFRARIELRRSASLRASVAGAIGLPVQGPRRYVGVLRRAHLTVTPALYESIAGRPFAISGAVSPSRPGERVLIEGSRDGGPWRPVARLPLRNGRLAGSITAPTGGRWRFRVTAAARRGLDDGGSAAVAPIDVYAANPDGVPRSEPRYLVQHISKTELYYYEYGRLRRVFPVVFGAPGTPTPHGSFRVYSKTAGPRAAFGPLVLWYHRGYGIHGTDQEYLLARSWRYYSHGCTRNYNANIYWLWDRVPVGTPVRNVA